nr:MAG TPA: hypothetical protein [Caudoviricetes sp.]
MNPVEISLYGIARKVFKLSNISLNKAQPNN